MSETTKRKISETQKGKPGLSGSDNPMWKTGANAITDHLCAWCGSAFVGPGTRKYCSRSCLGKGRMTKLFSGPEGEERRARYSEARIGEGNPNWQGGRSFELHSPGFTKALKKEIRERDENKCQECGVGPTEKDPLLVHHIDGGKTDHSPGNLILLCRSCHMLIHHYELGR